MREKKERHKYKQKIDKGEENEIENGRKKIKEKNIERENNAWTDEKRVNQNKGWE